MTLYLHIGLHKTGTTSLQEFLRSNREALAAEGYAFPQAGYVQGGHHNVAYELLAKKRFDPEAGTLHACLEEANAAPNAIISSEEFEFLDFDQVRRLARAVGERPVRIIVYLRRQDVLIPSTYVQQARMGAAIPSFEDYVRTCLYHTRFDFSQLLVRWGTVFGRDSLEVSVIAPETSGPLLYEDFIDRIGLGSRNGSLTPLDRIANPTPGRAHLEIVRRVFARIPARQRIPPQKMRQVGPAAEARVRRNPRLRDTGRLELDPGQWARVAQRYGAGNRWVAREFIASASLGRALVFDAPPVDQPAELDEESLDAAASEVIATLDLIPAAAGDPAAVHPVA